MSVNLLADIFGAHWDTWQDVLIIGLIAGCVLLIVLLIVFALTSNARMESDSKRMAKRVAWYERQIDLKKQKLNKEKEKMESELEEQKAELKEKEQKAEEMEAEVLEARKKMTEGEEKIRKLMEQAEMTKKELAEYQKREGTNVSEDVAVNALTDKTLNSSELQMNPDINDCLIPIERTFGCAMKDVVDYIMKKPRISVGTATGKRPVVFKVEDKTFAFVQDLGDGKFRLTFKCGPAYGAKLIRYKRAAIQNAKFPYGILWFSLSNETEDVSLELITLVLDISYRIARLGY